MVVHKRNMKLGQRKWKLIEDYDYLINYHPGKTNVVVDALSRKTIGFLPFMQTMQLPLMVDLKKLGVELSMHSSIALLASFRALPIFIDHCEAQLGDPN